VILLCPCLYPRVDIEVHNNQLHPRVPAARHKMKKKSTNSDTNKKNSHQKLPLPFYATNPLNARVPFATTEYLHTHTYTHTYPTCIHAFDCMRTCMLAHLHRPLPPKQARLRQLSWSHSPTLEAQAQRFSDADGGSNVGKLGAVTSECCDMFPQRSLRSNQPPNILP